MDAQEIGTMIQRLREQQNLTQKALAERLAVSDKTISKWETGRGLPDMSLFQPLAEALQVSISELFSGVQIVNQNRSGNLKKMGVACQAKRKKVTRKTQKTALIYPIYGNQSGFSYVI